jgi:hypothetical protein
MPPPAAPTNDSAQAAEPATDASIFRGATTVTPAADFASSSFDLYFSSLA